MSCFVVRLSTLNCCGPLCPLSYVPLTLLFYEMEYVNSCPFTASSASLSSFYLFLTAVSSSFLMFLFLTTFTIQYFSSCSCPHLPFPSPVSFPCLFHMLSYVSLSSFTTFLFSSSCYLSFLFSIFIIFNFLCPLISSPLFLLFSSFTRYSTVISFLCLLPLPCSPFHSILTVISCLLLLIILLLSSLYMARKSYLLWHFLFIVFRVIYLSLSCLSY